MKVEVVTEMAFVGDEVKMQEKCLSADERQSTIRQSGGGDNGRRQTMDSMTHLGG
jgi:hypothetical protein